MGASRRGSAPPVIRLAHPLAFAAFLEHIGAPVEGHRERQGLPELSMDPNTFIPLRKAWAFLDAAAQSEDPSLGWHVGRFVGTQNLNRGLLRKLEHKPTLLKALQELIRLSWTETSHIQLGIWEHHDYILMCTHYSGMKGVTGYTASQAYQLGLFIELVRHFAGQQWAPDEIGIEDSIVPGLAKKLFPRSRFLTRQPVGYIAIPRSCLHLAPPRVGGENVDSFEMPDKWDYVVTLRALLKLHLSDRSLSASLAASLMDTSLSTLKRRLSASGTTYRAVVDEVRFEKAKELLENNSARIIDVAAAVGFDDPSYFSKMFRRVGGISPSGLRKNMRQMSTQK